MELCPWRSRARGSSAWEWDVQSLAHAPTVSTAPLAREASGGRATPDRKTTTVATKCQGRFGEEVVCGGLKTLRSALASIDLGVVISR
uniref:Uncharacterized protein n=1 Tax=Oryza punctata TaxID=4537 RepID=A0A0E0KSJ6_ORYPU